MRYLPVKMKLDPKESINNMGHVRVDVLEASELPAADRNGFSDPYCKFTLNGKEVFKSSEQKRTLNPVWRQYFEVPVPSRIGADFKVHVYDSDTLGNDDFLGGAAIDLSLLEPLRPREYKLALDGKSGIIRLRALFRPEYVTRARQGTSTFSGSLAPSRAMTGLANAPMKGASFVSDGVSKGASFFKSSKKKDKDSKTAEAAQAASALAATMTAKRFTMSPTNQASSSSSPPPLPPPSAMNGELAQSSPAPAPPPQTPQASSLEPKTPSSSPPHGRSTSFGGRSIASVAGVAGHRSGGAPEMGVATFMIVAAHDYPVEAKVRVQIKQLTAKGVKEVHKTKSMHPSPSSSSSTSSSSSPSAGGGGGGGGSGADGFSSVVKYEQETFKVNCTADTQFQIVVSNHSAFRNLSLGESIFFVDDSSSSTGSEKAVKVGNGTVVLRTSFARNGSGGNGGGGGVDSLGGVGVGGGAGGVGGVGGGGRESSNASGGGSSSGRSNNPFRHSVLK